MVRIVGNTREEDIAFYPEIERDIVTEQGEFQHQEGIIQADPWNRMSTRINLVADSRDPGSPLSVTFDPPLGKGWEWKQNGEIWTQFSNFSIIVTGKHGEDEKQYALPATAYPCPPVASMLDYPEFDPNSLIGHIHANVSYLLQGVTPGAATQDQWLPGSTISYSYTTPQLTPNPNLWCKDLDFSCVSVTRNGSTHNFPAVLMNERYVISAHHVDVVPGVKLLFRRKDGSYVTATVTKRMWPGDITPENYIEELGGIFADVAVSELDIDVTGIEPAWFFDEQIDRKISNPINATNITAAMYSFPPARAYYYRFPTITRTANPGGTGPDPSFNSPTINTLSPHFRTLMANLRFGQCSVDTWGAMMRKQSSDPDFRVWPDNERLDLYRKFSHLIYGGDSSSPNFVPVVQSSGLKPVMIMTQYNAANGFFVGGKALKYLVQCMNLMAAQRGSTKTYGVQVADLSSFNDYTDLTSL